MAQQNIDFGTFPDDPDADAIRTAFQKVQNNFDELFATTTAGSVTSVNRGAGIDVNTPTGNVIVTANLAQVVVNTSSLSIGRGSNGGTTATLTTSAQILVIDINPANVFSGNFSGVSGALANLNGTLTANSNSQPNITSVGTLTGLAVTGNVTAGNIYANSGTIGATNLTGTLTTAAQPNITSVGTLGNLAVTGNSNLGNIASANFFSGDGYLLSNLTIAAGSSLINGNSNVIVGASSNVTISSTGNANVLIVTGTGSNVNGYLTVSGNIIGSNANLGNAVTANYFIGNLYGNANTAGTVTTNAQPNITSVGTLTSLNVTGNITSGNVYANSGLIKAQYLSGDGSNLTNLNSGITITNGNSNVNIPSANGNVNISAVGNANIAVVTGTGANINGTLNVTGTITGNLSGNIITATQSNITSLGTLTGLNVNGTSNLGAVGNVKITGSVGFLQGDGAGNLSFASVITQTIPGVANVVLLSGGTGANTIISSGNIKFNDPQLDITGTIAVTGNANVGNLTTTSITGTLTSVSNNQSNIKVVGTLDYLIINATGYLSMGGANISAGNISLVAAGSANLGNSATANYFIGSGNNLSNISGSNVNGTVSSATTAGTVTTNAQPNITSVGTLTSLTVTGNISAGNINAGNLLTANYTTTVITTNAQPNITSVGTLTSLNSSGNITAPSHIANTGYFIRSVSAAVSAAGTIQSNATVLTTEFNRVSTVASGAGVVLPSATAGMAIVIVNTSANSLLVYPATGAAINSLATNASYSHVTLATLQYIAISSTQWYTVGASYA
jgi:hypothetical protein